MPRVYHVKKCRKDQGNCSKCLTPILAGDPYLYWEFYRQSAVKRCTKPGCAPRPQDLTQSDFWLGVYDAQDALALVADASDVESVISDLETLRSSIKYWTPHDLRVFLQAAGLYLQWRYGVTVHHLEIKRRLLKIMYGGK